MLFNRCERHASVRKSHIHCLGLCAINVRENLSWCHAAEGRVAHPKTSLEQGAPSKLCLGGCDAMGVAGITSFTISKWYAWSVPWGLRRYQQAKDMHFVTFSCYRRQQKLATLGSQRGSYILSISAPT